MSLEFDRSFSCRKLGDKWIVAMNKWQDMTDMEVNEGMESLLKTVKQLACP